MKLESATAKLLRPARGGPPFAAAINAGNLDAATACFARDGCLITPDATAIHGRERIRPLLSQLLARQTEIEVELSSRLGAADVVLVQERWRVRSGGDAAGPIEQLLTPTLVLRRIEDAWKLAIAAPWGWGRASL
jgi:ketosteroid isomerase-like protein